MSIKERVAEMVHRLAVQLAEEQTEDKPKTQLASAMLENGQEIQTSAEAFAEGADVFVVNDEGENIPLPDGDYTLEDGTAFAVAEGIITAMGEAETEAASEEPKELSEEPAPEAVQEPTALSREDVQAMIDEAVKSATTQLSEQFAEEMAAKSEQIQQLSEQPAAKLSRQEPRQIFSRQDLAAMSLKERVRALSN